MSAAWFNAHRVGQGCLGAWSARVLALFMAVLLAACGGESDKSLDDFAGTPPPIPAANAAGKVTDAASGLAISGAIVTIGGQSIATGADGRFLLRDVPASTSTLVQVTAAGYMDALVVTNTVPGLTASVAVRMLAIAASTAVNAGAGGTASVGGTPAQVTIGADTLAGSDGSSAAGSVTLALTPIDMAQGLSTAPGDYTTSSGSPLEGFGGLSVTATGSSGALDLATGEVATIRIPVASRSATLPATLNLFRFDATTGRWVQGASAVLAGTAPSQYYEGNINKLGTWAAGVVITPVVYVNGCVVREGSTSVVAGVRVETEGITYSGRSSGVTDAAGRFRIPVKTASSMIVSGIFGNYLTNTQSTTTAAADVTLPTCLVLSALSGAPRITLTWGASPADVDSHVFAPDGTHVYYAAKGTLTAAPYVALDVDDITSYGPEVMTFTKLMVGTYTYGVRNYLGTDTPGLTGSPVRIELRRGSEVKVYSPTVAQGETTSTDWWTVFTFTVDASCNITVNDVGVFSIGGDSGPAAPARPAAVAPTYCTPPAVTP